MEVSEISGSSRVVVVVEVVVVVRVDLLVGETLFVFLVGGSWYVCLLIEAWLTSLPPTVLACKGAVLRLLAAKSGGDVAIVVFEG